MAEMARAVACLKDDKSPGGGGRSAEVWKHGGDNMFSRLYQLIAKAWEVGSVPRAWKDAGIVTIYKKDDRTYCETLQRNLSSFHSRQDLCQCPPQ